jgi:hypothetical protein
MQALSRAVHTAFHDVIPHLPLHTLIWIRDTGYPEKLLTLSPNSNHSFTETTHHLLTHYLCSIPDSSIELRTFHWTWTRKRLQETLMRIPASHPPLPPLLDDTHPKQAAWNTFLEDYTLSDHPSAAACTPPPMISTALAFGNRVILSTIFRLITRHYFDTDYSDWFCPSANDNTQCPCARPPAHNPTQPWTLSRPTRQAPPCHMRCHVLFRCCLHNASQVKHFPGVSNLPTIFRSRDLTYSLCAFLAETNSTLLRLLPVLHPGRDPPL